VTGHLLCKVWFPYLESKQGLIFNQPAVFFSHNKLANGAFSHLFSAKRTGCMFKFQHKIWSRKRSLGLPRFQWRSHLILQLWERRPLLLLANRSTTLPIDDFKPWNKYVYHLTDHGSICVISLFDYVADNIRTKMNLIFSLVVDAKTKIYHYISL
jgi:hypothetical protein